MIGQEELVAGARAPTAGECARFGIDQGTHDAGRRFEGGVAARRTYAVGEAGPDGQGGAGAGEARLRVVVVPDPDQARPVGRVAAEPAVATTVGGAGLARESAFDPLTADA